MGCGASKAPVSHADPLKRRESASSPHPHPLSVHSSFRRMFSGMCVGQPRCSDARTRTGVDLSGVDLSGAISTHDAEVVQKLVDHDTNPDGKGEANPDHIASLSPTYLIHSLCTPASLVRLRGARSPRLHPALLELGGWWDVYGPQCWFGTGVHLRVTHDVIAELLMKSCDVETGMEIVWPESANGVEEERGKWKKARARLLRTAHRIGAAREVSLHPRPDSAVNHPSLGLVVGSPCPHKPLDS